MNNHKPNYTLVGLFVLVLTVIMILFIFWLTSLRHHESYEIYRVYLSEEISGLSKGSPVRYNGVKVGYVSTIKLNPLDPQQVILTLKIQEGTPITTSTIASLKSEGITGVDYIGLKARTPNAPLLKKLPGEDYPVIPSEPSLLLKLSTAVQQVTRTVQDFGKNINQVFSEANQKAINQSLNDLSQITTDARQTLPNISRELQNALTQIIPQVQQLLTQLNATSANVQELSEELKNNPSILLRGRSPIPPGPGEK